MRGILYIPRNNGFTLVEIIISIVLLGILAAVGSSMISDTFRTTKMVDANQASRAQIRYAVERLAREIREVKYVSKGTAFNGTTTNYTGYCIGTISASSLTFKKPIAGDLDKLNCATNTTPVNISVGSTVTLNSSPLASNVISPYSLAYYLQDGITTTTTAGSTTTTDPSAFVRFVVITLTVRDSGQSITERTRVALRDAP